jgi:hypothetical protein
MKTGTTGQETSSINLSTYLFSASVTIIYATTVMIIRMIINVWSWN